MTTPALDAAEVHVWLVDPAAPAELRSLARARRLLDASERRRMERLRTQSHRDRFAISHALVRRALSRYAPVPPAAWRFARGARGRPELAAPQLGHGLRFNLSHTDGLAACAVVRDLDIGVDAEAAARVREPVKLAARFFAPAEAAAVRALPADAQRGGFLDYWTLKEAYMKARGLGFALRLRDFCFELAAGSTPQVRFDARLGDDASAWQFDLRVLPNGHRLAIALRRGARRDLAVRVFDGAELAETG